ncbi:MAG TPA: transaldolase family protein, partial [Actinomycetales bacterium]|nr:transaldolase family protein [Actinomycetales bacterium]
MTDPLAQLSAAGVAVWLDDISRDRLRTGNLGELIRDRHVVGVTTNPSIFQKAISGSEVYDPQVRDRHVVGVTTNPSIFQKAISGSEVYTTQIHDL